MKVYTLFIISSNQFIVVFLVLVFSLIAVIIMLYQFK